MPESISQVQLIIRKKIRLVIVLVCSRPFTLQHHLMRSSLIIFLLIQAVVTGFCQSDKNYRQRALEIQHEIWDDTSAKFKVTKIPAEMNRESAVILAYSFDLNDNSKFAFKLSGHAQKLKLQVTDHIRIKLNDRNAIADYSKIEYGKNINDTHVHMYDIYWNVSDTYVGVKIIRPDGTETVMNTIDDMLKKNGKTEDTLYIPGLQEGDILDFYTREERMQDVGYSIIAVRPYTFVLGDRDYPTIYEKLKFRFGESFRAQYISANGAPALIRSRDADANTTLELTQTNLPRSQDTLWISALRQMPFIRFELLFIEKGETDPDPFAGEVKPGSMYSKYIERTSENLSNPRVQFSDQPLRIAKNYFGGSEKMKRASHDSIAKVLYDAWYYFIFNSTSNGAGDYIDKVKYSHAIKLNAALEMSKMLTSLGINNTVYLVCSRNSVSFKNITDLSEMDALVYAHADSTHGYWMAFDDILTVLNEIPARFQGELAFGIQNVPKSEPLQKQPENIKLPISTAADNTITDSIQVNFDASNPLLLHIGQKSKITGSPRHQIQRELMLFDDIDSALAAPVSQKSIMSKLESKSGKKDAFQSIYEKERVDQKINFTGSIQSRFGSVPKEVLNYEVFNPSLCRVENSFSYRILFTMEHWVTDHNNQYKVKVGKLIGDYQDIAKQEHIRSMNVYLPDARTFNIDIRIDIPDGYQVKDTGDLNIAVSNETGSCKSSTTITGHLLTWHVSEIFLNNFEPASNWPKLAEILHAMYVMSQKEITMEKS